MATRTGAPTRVPLTRDRIVEAALHVMDEEGLDAVTMRRVAREVGVEAMSLYNHVRDKEDLLDGICTLVMAAFRFPDEDRPWGDVVHDGASEWRRVLKQHPNVIALFAECQRPMTEVDALQPMEFALRVIQRAGLDEREAVQVFNVMGGYIMGFVMMEVGRMFGAGTQHRGSPDAEPAEAMPDPVRLPCIAASIPYLATCDPDEQFEFGLQLMIAGLQTRYGSNDA